MKTLRQRIRRCGGICCSPWRVWRGELDYVALSFMVLFKNEGIPIDIVEEELLSEGWLLEGESLLEIMKDKNNLKRTIANNSESSNYGNLPDDWEPDSYD